MDAIRNIYRQSSRIFLAMTPSQRAVVVCVSAIVTIGLALVIKNGWQPDSQVPLSWGKKFDRDELIRAEQTLTEAGLSNFRTVGQQILVPSNEAERYNAELLTAGHLPANPISEFEKQFEKNIGMFPTKRAMDESRDIALRNTIRGVLRAIPEIQDANVLWARDTKRSRWQDPSKVTATVNIRPRAGKELSLRLIHSLFVSVAAMISDLDAKDVVVLDQSNGRSYLWDTVQQSRDNRLLDQRSQLNEWYRSKILNAISFIPNVRVSVSVALRERLPSKRRVQKPRESQSPVLAPPFGLQLTSIRIPGSGLVDDTVVASSNEEQFDSFITETDTSGHTFELLSEVNQSRMAESVHVVVSIPEDYYQMIASNRDVQRDDTEYSFEVSKIRTAEISKVESIVKQLVFQGSPSDSVSVSSYFRIGSDNAPTMSSATSSNQQLKWGSVVGLSVGALLLLWFLVRGFNRNQSEMNLQRLDSSSAGLESNRESRKDAELSNHSHPRERLQTLVKNDLDSAATIVSKWIQATS